MLLESTVEKDDRTTTVWQGYGEFGVRVGCQQRYRPGEKERHESRSVCQRDRFTQYREDTAANHTADPDGNRTPKTDTSSALMLFQSLPFYCIF
jgi:hypothetical protein